MVKGSETRRSKKHLSRQRAPYSTIESFYSFPFQSLFDAIYGSRYEEIFLLDLKQKQSNVNMKY